MSLEIVNTGNINTQEAHSTECSVLNSFLDFIRKIGAFVSSFFFNQNHTSNSTIVEIDMQDVNPAKRITSIATPVQNPKENEQTILAKEALVTQLKKQLEDAAAKEEKNKTDLNARILDLQLKIESANKDVNTLKNEKDALSLKFTLDINSLALENFKLKNEINELQKLQRKEITEFTKLLEKNQGTHDISSDLHKMFKEETGPTWADRAASIKPTDISAKPILASTQALSKASSSSSSVIKKVESKINPLETETQNFIEQIKIRGNKSPEKFNPFKSKVENYLKVMKSLKWDINRYPKDLLNAFKQEFQTLIKSEPSFAKIAARNILAPSSSQVSTSLPSDHIVVKQKMQPVLPVEKLKEREKIAEEIQPNSTQIMEEKQDVSKSSSLSNFKKRSRGNKKRLEEKNLLRTTIIEECETFQRQVNEVNTFDSHEMATQFEEIKYNLEDIILDLENKNKKFDQNVLKKYQSDLKKYQSVVESFKKPTEEKSLWRLFSW